MAFDSEPTIICPKCRAEIKLTESLAAPLVESIRHDYEEKLIRKDADMGKRETALRDREAEIVKARESIEGQVAEKVKQERTRIAAEEAKKARTALGSDLDQKTKELADLQSLLSVRDQKLAEAQKAQTDLLRKQRELEEARREMELTVENRIQAGLALVREQTRKETEIRLGRDVQKCEQTISEMEGKLTEAQKAQTDLLRKQREIEEAKRELELTVENRIQVGLSAVREQARKETEIRLGRDVQKCEQTISEMEGKLAEAQKAQADLMRKQRELDDAKREMELTIEKRVQENLTSTRDQARKETEESMKLRVMEKEQTITSMQKQIEELKRRAEQGSQQLQGEVQELELEALLRVKFPRDTIEPVPKGEHGGDALHRVLGPLGQLCGTILWESKRTKNWSDGWLVKLRDDQRVAKAEIAVLVTHALPKDLETFDLVEGVWVTTPRAALPVAMALRQMLMEIAMARQASEGQQTKMEMVYQYLMGPRFRHRVQAIVEAFSSMREDLDKEKKAITKQWAKREEQTERVLQATVGMYGDLQGIAGRSMQEIEGLEIRALEEGE